MQCSQPPLSSRWKRELLVANPVNIRITPCQHEYHHDHYHYHYDHHHHEHHHQQQHHHQHHAVVATGVEVRGNKVTGSTLFQQGPLQFFILQLNFVLCILYFTIEFCILQLHFLFCILYLYLTSCSNVSIMMTTSYW